MEFIALVIALALERWTDVGNKVRSLRAVNSYLKRVQHFAEQSHLKNVHLHYAVTLILAMALVGVTHLILMGLSPHVLNISFEVLILFYCLGSGFYKGMVEDPAAKITSEVETVWQTALQRLFGVIFWFMFLGPAGAILYRLNEHLTHRYRWKEVQPSAQYMQLLLDWIPVRLMGLSFALMGNFYKTMRVWRDRLFHKPEENNQFLNACGMAAVSFQDEDHDSAIYRLLNLSLVSWLVAFLVITMVMK